MAEVASYLVSLGHRRIGYVSGPPGFLSARERREGFTDALRDHGLELADDRVVTGGYTYESGFAGGEELLARTPRPTAIFASNDEMAAGVYRAAHNQGLAIPRELSVVGYDDGPIAARLMPPLTTVRQPMDELGRAAVQLAMASRERAAGTPRRERLTTQLIVRESTAPPA